MPRKRKKSLQASDVTSSASGQQYSTSFQSKGGERGIIKNIGLAGAMSLPQVTSVAMYHGVTASTDWAIDRDFTSKPQAVIIPGFINWWFSNQAYNVADQVATSISTLAQAMYGEVVRRIQSKHLRTIRDTILDNTDVPAPDPHTYRAMIEWLNLYSCVFGITRCLESVYRAGTFNQALNDMSAVGMQYRPRLDGLVQGLMEFPVPPKLVTLLDTLSGVKVLDADSPARIYIAGLPTDDPLAQDALDLRTTAVWEGLLTHAENTLNNLQRATIAVQVNDFQRILNTFAQAYGYGAKFPQKEISREPGEYDLFTNLVCTWHQVGGVSPTPGYYAFPDTAYVASEPLPTFIRKGTSAEASTQLCSFFTMSRRASTIGGVPPFVPVASGTVLPEIGLFQNPSAVDWTVSTNPGTTYTVITSSGSAIHLESNGSMESTGHDNLTSLYNAGPIWQRYIFDVTFQNGIADYGIDSRSHSEFDIIKPTVAEMFSATRYRLLDMFVEDIK